jgi:hypothetical protein
MDGMSRRYYALCRDSVTGMEFDFDLDSTSRKAAMEEAHCKYNGVVLVAARESKRAAGVALKPLDEEPRKSLNDPR